MTSRVRVYLGCSLDGFIAGPDDDLSWLIDPPEEEGDAVGFFTFMEEVGALLMGRRTWSVVEAFDGWFYGETPVLVATHRELACDRPTVQAVSGSIEEVVAAARTAAGDKDVYIDGGDLVRQALDAGLVDELILTVGPIVIGDGVRLFDGVVKRHHLEFTKVVPWGRLFQIHARPVAAE